MRSRGKKRNVFKASFLILILIFLGIISFSYIFKTDKVNNDQNNNKVLDYYPVVDQVVANINKYYIYGMSFNVEGSLDKKIDTTNLKEIVLVLKTKEETIPLKTSYQIEENKLLFQSSDVINDGIILDDIEIGDYFLLLSVTLNDEKPIYYTLENNTEYDNFEYYTMTKNNKNKKINLDFMTKNDTPYITLSVVNKNLPEDVYDIVIDPGHGGVDVGASYKGRSEAPINLDVAKKVKTELEKLGLKVKLTRDGNYNPGHKSGSNQYGPGGRVSIPYEVKAKYLISIHVNYDEGYIKQGGLEIYMASASKLDFARLLVDNILNNTGIKTSPNPTNREEKGIYVRTFLNSDIKELKEQAEKYNFEMYDIKPNTPYYYMIRETGGIVTGAYIDGRHPKYSKNDYYKSNVGIESYIIELGYLNSDTDYNIITGDQDGYAKGIAKSFENYILKE